MSDRIVRPFKAVTDFYLHNRWTQAISTALACGLVGLSLGLLFGAVLVEAHSLRLLVGFLVALVFAGTGARSSLKETAPARVSFQGFLASFLGGAILFCTAATVLGITGGANMAVALGASLLVSLWLSTTRRR
jgi:hypothetical protein